MLTIIQLMNHEFNMKYITRQIRKLYNNKFIVIHKVTGHSGHVYKLYIKEPNADTLLKMGYKSATRGYRYKCRNKKSIHVLPTGEGWQVHVDTRRAGTHKVMKSRWAEVYINKFLTRYPIWNH